MTEYIELDFSMPDKKSKEAEDVGAVTSYFQNQTNTPIAPL